MNIVVFGAGSIGSLLGGLLARTHDVTLIGREPHVRAIQQTGLRIEASSPQMVPVKAATSTDDVTPPDLVLLSVKSYDTSAALQALRPLLRPRTILLGIQNGLGNWEQALQAYPDNPVLAAAVTYGAFTPRPGAVAWNGSGEITIGGRPEHETARDQIQREFQRASLNVKTTDNIRGALWLKAIVNAAINPLTAIHRVLNGRLLEDPQLRQRMQQAAKEAARVADAEGVHLPVNDPVAEVERVAEMTRSNRSSMLQSVEKGLPIELEAITGAILDAAKRHNLSCPQNEALYQTMLRLGLPTLR